MAPTGVRPQAPEPDRTADGDALVRAACFECLREALEIYRAAGPRRSTDVFRAAILLEMRRREIGVLAEDFLEQARAVAPAVTGGPDTALWIEIADDVPWNVAALTNQERDRRDAWPRPTPEDRARRSAALEPMLDDPVVAYLYAAVNCDLPRGPREARTDWLERLEGLMDRHPGSPLVAYKVGTCTGSNPVILADLLDLEPRFVEAYYFLGQRELFQRTYEAAEQQLRAAYGTLSPWPATAVLLGDVLLGLEDYEAARELYTEALALVPEQREALLGEGRALSYLERHTAAIRPFDALLALGTWYVGEAYYWRAWNRFRLNELDVAWTDIEAAKKSLVSVDAFRLAGLIAFFRRDFGNATTNLSDAIELNPMECEALFYLGGVRAEKRSWAASGPTYRDAVACFESQSAATQAQIADLEQDPSLDARAMRLLLRRQRDLVSIRRFEANAAYNAAVSYFNDGRRDDAAAFAERAARHETFRERAQALIARLQR